MNRRRFIQKGAVGSLLLGMGHLPLSACADQQDYIQLTILHTNDVHSRIEPFPVDGGRFVYQGFGGAARRAALIKQVRQESENVLLLDAGDIFQGTPYFNFFDGELEFKLMNQMRYDAATIGNHDFDAGMEALAKQIDGSSFPLLNCNYGFGDTPLEKKTKPFTIIEKEGLKIGIFGLGIALDGLVPPKLYGATQYFDPLQHANATAAILRNEHKCHLIIALSHLGYKYKQKGMMCDVLLAQNSRNIDLILGGHTHTFMEEPDVVRNLDGEEVLINQVGWAGILLGRLDYFFRKDFRKKRIVAKKIPIR